jgi:DUF4097 and DUF4098 domain-containing protein YvlB
MAGTSRAQAAEDYFKSYAVNGRPLVRVSTDDGSVRVMTTDSNQVEFHARYEGSDWGLHMGDPPRINSHQNGNVVELNARVNWNMVIGYSSKRLRIEVRMPRDADLELDTGDGSVEVASLNGDVKVHTADGSIKAAQLAGKVELRSNDGSITVEDLKGDLKLHTSDGSIRGSNLAGRCQASSGDGSIQVAGRFDSLDIRSGDGSIAARAEAGSQMASSWSLQTHDGSVHLALPRDFKASVDASTGDGHIRSELPVEVQGEFGHKSIHGTMNGGGPSVVIRTGDGSIELAAT